MKKLLFILVIILAISLRLFKLGQNPPSLYWDEASLGYNAYTIATSFHDEHGEFLPLSRFIAFGDYKPPGYIYVTAPSILLFGLNEFAVRFPSMLAGLLMVIFTYFVTKELFNNVKIALSASLLLAISPWALQFSRAAFEANLAAAFNLLGVYFFLKARRHKPAILLSAVFFILSFYTFNANRIIAPLLLIGLSVFYFRTLLSNKKWVLISVVTALILFIPSISFLNSRESRLRFQEVSIFNNLEPVVLSNGRISADGNSWFAKLMHNRRLFFASDFLKHYFDNFSGRFLFTHGDVNPRLSTQSMGELYPWDLPFLLMAVYWLVKKKESGLPVLILWMIIAPIPAATARETPHALRVLSVLPTFQIIIAYGLYQLIKASPSRSHFVTPGRWPNGLLPGGFKKIIIVVICFMLSANIFYYLHDYYIHYPLNWAGEWQYGYKQMVSYVTKVEGNYDYIYVTNALGRPYIYFAFYQQYSQKDFLRERIADRDWFGFWDVKALGKIRFEFDSLKTVTGKILAVTIPGNVPGGYHLLRTVKNPKGEDVFVISDKI